MAYEPKLDWVDDPDAGQTKQGMTPIKASDLKRIEQGIADAHGVADSAAPADHDHAIADVAGLQDALDGKQASGSYATTAQVNAKADQSALDALETRIAALEADTPEA